MHKSQFILISIDGAAGSGKSTTSIEICKKFKYIHVDTGLHYRSLSKFLLVNGISPDLCSNFLQSNSIELSSIIEKSDIKLQLDGMLFSDDELRSEEMNTNVSFYARLPVIRSLLLSYQRSLPAFVKNQGFSGMIMNGRDIGSVVLPNAHLKFFLHADIDIRLNRRTSDGENDSISQRDTIDSTRIVAPLTCPDGAISIDTGILSVKEVIKLISQQITNLG